jgi:hypothetical protein
VVVELVQPSPLHQPLLLHLYRVFSLSQQPFALFLLILGL